MKTKNAFLIILGVGIIGFIYFFYVGTAGFITPTNLTVSLKWVPQAQFAGMYVAKDEGFYEDRNLTVFFDEFEPSKSIFDKVISGESDFGLVNGTEYILRYGEDPSIQAIAAFYQYSPYVVAGLKGTNITSPAELRGKTIGLKGATNEARSVFAVLLGSANIGDDEVTFVSLPFGPSERDDLVEDKADVVGFYRTRLYQFEKDAVSYNAIYPERYGAAPYNDVLIARKDFLEANPKIARNFIKATVKGWKHAFNNKGDAIATTLRYVEDDEYRDIEYEQYILDVTEDLMRPDASTVIGIMDEKRWQESYDSLKNRIDFTPFTVTDAFTNEFVK